MNTEIAICGAGAAITALVLVWVLVRAARPPRLKSAADARRRTGADRALRDAFHDLAQRDPEQAAKILVSAVRSAVKRDNPDGNQVRIGPGPQFARGGKGGPNGEGGKGGVARNTGPVASGPGYPGPATRTDREGPGGNFTSIEW